MTDTFADGTSVASRLGVTARVVNGQLVLDLSPRPEVMHHGVVRASVLAFVMDAVAGIAVDTDPEVWTLTSDLSVRMRPRPAPTRIEAIGSVLRQGGRSVTCAVELTSDEGELVATGALGFAKVPRRDSDPPKPRVRPDTSVAMFSGLSLLSQPLREEAGIEVIDPVHGEVQLRVTPELRNPAGTLQGAMVALVAEAAAEDMVSTRFESPVVVTDLDVRYLARAPEGPVRSKARLLGDGPEAAVEVELVDTSVNRVTTLVYARTAAIRS